MKRLYDTLLRSHLESDHEMLFLTGPRQVGKTTVSKNAQQLSKKFIYLNWDDEDHRKILLQGPAKIIEQASMNTMSDVKPIIAFDEIHKRPDWKNFLKGFYDSYANDLHIIVTGSSRLDIYKQGGDSLMGRYFPYRMHPLTVGECLRTNLQKTEISEPSQLDETVFKVLYEFGGFPNPFIKRDNKFSIRWQRLRKQQLLREDIRDVNVIQDLNRLQILMDILQSQAALQINYSNLAKLTRVSADTISRWFEILESFYFCYRIRPWTRNITRSLIKEPKIYLWDWSVISNPGRKAENFIANHLLKSVHFWTDCGFGNYELYYIRTKDKEEIDFLVTKNDQPWFLLEVKQSNHKKISPHLEKFQEQSGAEHAFQVVIDMPYVNKNCFDIKKPIIVPARTFLSQLV